MAIMASLHCNEFAHASIAWPVIQFWGSWLGTVKRKRREADRKLVAGCYLSDRRPQGQPSTTSITKFDGPPQTRGAVISDRDRAINGKVFRA